MRKYSFCPCYLSPKVVVRRLVAVVGGRFRGVHFESFPVGFSMPGLSDTYFDFLGDNVSEKLASRGSPALSCFSAVAGRTFEYGSKLKLNFGWCILDSPFGIFMDHTRLLLSELYAALTR